MEHFLLESKQAAFLKAVEKNERLAVLALWSSCDALGKFHLLRASTVYWPSPVYCAVCKGNIDILRWLLQVSQDPLLVNLSSKAGETPLMIAVAHEKLEIARLLLQYGADALAGDAKMRTPLCLAAQTGNAEMISLLHAFASRNDRRFGCYVGCKLDEIWNLNEIPDPAYRRDYCELMKLLRVLCRSKVGKTALLEKLAFGRFRILSESPRLCSCSLILLLNTCLELLYAQPGEDAGALFPKAIIQFCDTNWPGRCLELLVANWLQNDRAQHVCMPVMQLLIATFVSLDVGKIVSMTSFSGKIAKDGMKIFFRALGIYQYFQGCFSHSDPQIKKKSGLIWMKFLYCVKNELKRQLFIRCGFREGDLAEECVRVFTPFRCECTQEETLGDIPVPHVTTTATGPQQTPQVLMTLPLVKFLDFKPSTLEGELRKTPGLLRSTSLTTELKPEIDGGKKVDEKSTNELQRSVSFTDFGKLHYGGESKPREITTTSMLSGEDSGDTVYLSNPFNRRLEYSACYIEALTTMLRHVATGKNPIYPSEDLDYFDVLTAKETPAYLTRGFLHKRANALVKKLETVVVEKKQDSNLISAANIDSLIANHSKVQHHERKVSSQRFHALFESLINLPNDRKFKVKGNQGIIALPKDKYEMPFIIGRRPGAKMTLSILDQSGQKSRGVVVKIFGRDGTADVCVKRLLDFTGAFALATSIETHVISYKLFLSDSQTWYIARSVCDYNLDELIDLYCYGQASARNNWNPRMLLRECFEGLNFLHTRPAPIFHGNLKPANILIDAKGTARLADFGFGKFLTPAHELSSTCVMSRLPNGRVHYDPRCWKPLEYFVPKSQYVCASDIESMALLGYYALSEGTSHPFIQSDTMELAQMESVLTAESCNIEESVIPREAHQLFRDMFESQAQDRPIAADILEHSFFWTTYRRGVFILVTAYQPEIALCLHSLKGESTQIEAVEILRAIDMTPWMQAVPPNDPVLDKRASQNPIYLDNSALSFLIYVGIYYSKYPQKDAKMRNLNIVLEMFQNEFLSIFRAVRQAGWTSRECYNQVKNCQK